MMDMDDCPWSTEPEDDAPSRIKAKIYLQTANRWKPVAVSTPGSNPYLTAQATGGKLRCQAYMQMMIAAELRQEAGRMPRQCSRKAQSTMDGGVNSLIPER